MRSPTACVLGLVLGLVLLAPCARAAEVLLMLDEQGCQWCARWDAEVGGIYAKTAEGRQAPLERRGIREALPEGVSLVRPARYTPTFVLLKDGAEVGRIEGYPGEDFFYGLLGKLLEQAAATAAGGV